MLTEDDFKTSRKGSCWFKTIHDSLQYLELIGMISKVSKRRIELTERGIEEINKSAFIN